MKADGVTLTLEHDAFEIVVKQCPGKSAPRLKSLDMAAQEVLEQGIEKEAQEDRPRVAQYHDEAHQGPLGTADRVSAEVRPIDLTLFPDQCAHAQIDLGLGAGAMAGDDMAEVIGTAVIAALAHHGVEATCGERWELLERGKNKGQIRIDAGRSRAAKAWQARPGQYPGDGSMVDV